MSTTILKKESFFIYKSIHFTTYITADHEVTETSDIFITKSSQ